ncbi:hypothetical protein J121_424 [Qipengyuania citrea LAMA 915]|uniref:Uncharacterized protein n=1 Tax=Qipengyuania citrea LAMA 915 TaxID=1306953 RepID=A0A0L1KEZ3_9SPHN|nr:hypothetical protein [Qipengyuania citrea]KNH02640.1 hypothetical protein J121_424 [Qipengyuania citrea LAMA 915]
MSAGCLTHRDIANQDRRREELANLRLQRPLSEAELREEEQLENRLAMRVWRAQQRETEARLKEAA